MLVEAVFTASLYDVTDERSSVDSSCGRSYQSKQCKAANAHQNRTWNQHGESSLGRGYGSQMRSGKPGSIKNIPTKSRSYACREACASSSWLFSRLNNEVFPCVKRVSPSENTRMLEGLLIEV